MFLVIYISVMPIILSNYAHTTLTTLLLNYLFTHLYSFAVCEFLKERGCDIVLFVATSSLVLLSE